MPPGGRHFYVSAGSDGQGGVEGVAGGLHGVAGGLAGFADHYDLRREVLELLLKGVVGPVAHGQHYAVVAAHGRVLAGDGVGEVHAVGVELLDAGVDALILGCTHYPLLKTMIGEFMGQSVTLVDPAKTAAHHLEQMLSERGLRAAQEHEGQAHFYVSDVPDSFVQTADLFLGEYKGGPVDQIAIDKY